MKDKFAEQIRNAVVTDDGGLVLHNEYEIADHIDWLRAELDWSRDRMLCLSNEAQRQYALTNTRLQDTGVQT